MGSLQEFTQLLLSGQSLTAPACTEAAGALTDPEISDAERQAFLEALHRKGETVEEVTAFASVFRELATDPRLSDLAAEAIDVVGTGGTGSRGYNLSSVTALMLAASGIRVLKHGNRAITSNSGSADFLSALGIRMDTDPDLLRAACIDLNFCFFFAPAFHPAFKEIMPVRKKMAAEKKRSVFNILGPLINPAKPGYQLLGVFQPAWVKPMADSLHQLGVRRGFAVCCQLPGEQYMDEITTAGPNRMAGFGDFHEVDCVWDAADEGFPRSLPNDLAGGSAEENVRLMEMLMDNRGPRGLVDSLLLNVATALVIVGRAETTQDGVAMARECLLGGSLRRWLDKACQFYLDTSGSASPAQ